MKHRICRLSGRYSSLRSRAGASSVGGCGCSCGFNDNSPFHHVVADAAVLVAKQAVLPGLDETVTDFGHLARHDHLVDGRVRDAKTVDDVQAGHLERQDRKSTRLNSSHVKSSYAVFCL